jgi:8-amino-7-oxononanoate synthase
VIGLLEELESLLRDLLARSLGRTLTLPQGRDFSSNDYLGLSNDSKVAARIATALRAGPMGAPASRLLRGNTEAHQRLESRLAAFKGTEAALLFPSGYQANLAVLSTLVTPRDRVVTDRLNHASIIDGLKLARCRKAIVPHLDVEGIERALAEPHDDGRTFLVTESLFSMDGDIAPLDRYADLAERYGASLIVDDAHATGLYGPRSSGLAERFGVERRADAIVSTYGKALGLQGAFIAGPRVVIEYLVNRARPFVFSTAPALLLVAAWEGVLDIVETDGGRRRQVVLALADRLRERLRHAGLDCGASVGPIIPVMIGESEPALVVAKEVQAGGFDVRAIRPPTVEDGTARLRISVHADHTEAEIDLLAEAVINGVRCSVSGVRG